MLPGGPEFDLLGGSPYGLEAITMTLDKVTQDPNHAGFSIGDPASMNGGNLALYVPQYGILLDGGGPFLVVRDAFSFNLMMIDGLPVSDGLVFEDTDPGMQLNAYLENTDAVFAISVKRTLVSVSAVPEPASLLALSGLAGLMGWRLKRRKSFSL